MTHTRIHPKSLPITPGWSQIGPRSRPRPALKKRDVSKAFRETLSKQENRRIRKLRSKIAMGKADDTDLILGMFDNLLGVRPPRVITDKRGVTRAA